MISLENTENVQPNLAKQAAGKDEPRLATWGDVFWAWVIKGAPREEAAFRADEWERSVERERSGISGKLNRKARRAMKEQEPLGREFEAVWDANTDKLYAP